MIKCTEDEMYWHLSSKARMKRLLHGMGLVIMRIDSGIHAELKPLAQKVWGRLTVEDQAVLAQWRQECGF
jgi:hypothetical protein